MNSTARRIIPSALILIFLLTFPTRPVHAQSMRNLASHQVRLSVSEAAVLALNDPGSLDLTWKGEESRGLNYTMINAPGTNRAILVQWAAGDSAPFGTSLRIAATYVPYACGLAAPEVTVGNVPQSLITGIPSCTAGASVGGAVLRYRLNIEDELRTAGDTKSEVSIIFTILDR
jgi:hypothetical protein